MKRFLQFSFLFLISSVFLCKSEEVEVKNEVSYPSVLGLNPEQDEALKEVRNLLNKQIEILAKRNAFQEDDEELGEVVWASNAMGASQLAQVLETFISTANFTKLAHQVVPVVVRNQVESLVNFLYGPSENKTESANSTTSGSTPTPLSPVVVEAGIRETNLEPNTPQASYSQEVQRETLIRLLEESILIIEQQMLHRQRQQESSAENSGVIMIDPEFANNPQAVSQILSILETIFTGRVNFTTLSEHTSQLIPDPVRNTYQSFVNYFRGGTTTVKAVPMNLPNSPEVQKQQQRAQEPHVSIELKAERK